MNQISMSNTNLVYMGRIDFEQVDEPVFIYAGSMVKIRFKGTCLHVELRNKNNWNDHYLGIVIDDKYQNKIYLSKEDDIKTYVVAEHLEDCVHEIILYKCMDSSHYYQICGFQIDGSLLQATPFPERRMEFFGDSITAGACSEAQEYAGKADPPHTGEFDNAWYSYSMITARKLHASIHNIAQGGASLRNGYGYFEMDSGTRGIVDIYDKLSYVTPFGYSNWDFSKYTPHVVVVAVGQNDNHPMPEIEQDQEELEKWKCEYVCFLKKIREQYPKALIICMTSILRHHLVWDQRIQEACAEMKDEKITYHRFKRNAMGTDGHIRISEAYEMAEELSNCITSFGNNIWE